MSYLNKVIIGCGGHARAIISVFLEKNENHSIGLLENQIGYNSSESILGVKILGDLDFMYDLSHEFILGIGSIKRRNEILQNYTKINWYNVVSSYAIISPGISLGRGVFVAPKCFVGPEVTIGDHVILNTSSVIEHEVQIDENTHIAPNATLLGRCEVGRNVLIGANTVVLPGVKIGDNITIGANSLINRNLFESGTYVGSPAKKIKDETIL